MPSLPRAFLLLAGLVSAAGATGAANQAFCRPAIAPGPSGHSDVVNRQRTWTGTFAVDASALRNGSRVLHG